MKILKNFDARNIAKAKNKILLATASILFLALLFSSSAFREFVSKHPGLIGVLIAVSGEVYFDWKEESGRHAKWKKFFMALLVVSLAYELYEASESDQKAADSIKLASQANLQVGVLSNATVRLSFSLEGAKSNNLVLQTNVDSLNSAVLQLAHEYDLSTNALAEATTRLAEAKSADVELQKLKQDRIITPEKQMEFVNFLKFAPKKPMWVASASLAGETGRFVNKIRALLDAAGYGVASSSSPLDGMVYPNGIVEHGGGMTTDVSADIEIWVDTSDFNSPSFQTSAESQFRFAFEQIPDISVSVVNASGLGKGKSFIFVSPKQGF
jgi:hypothetical protein